MSARPVWLAIVLQVGATPWPAGAADAQEPPAAAEVLEEASSRYTGIHSICANFEQHLDIVLLGEERRGEGRMCHMAPNSFGMRFTEPAGDLVIADGEWVWLYNPSMEEGQVIRFAVSNAGGAGVSGNTRNPDDPDPSDERGSAGASHGAHNLFRDFLEDPNERYDASYRGREELEGAGETHRVRVRPRAAAGFVSAELWIDTREHLLHKVRIEDENGSVRTVRLLDLEVDPVGLDEGWFDFTPPPGTVVITR